MVWAVSIDRRYIVVITWAPRNITFGNFRAFKRFRRCTSYDEAYEYAQNAIETAVLREGYNFTYTPPAPKVITVEQPAVIDTSKKKAVADNTIAINTVKKAARQLAPVRQARRVII